jgi:hypothetical protein
MGSWGFTQDFASRYFSAVIPRVAQESSFSSTAVPFYPRDLHITQCSISQLPIFSNERRFCRCYRGFPILARASGPTGVIIWTPAWYIWNGLGGKLFSSGEDAFTFTLYLHASEVNIVFPEEYEFAKGVRIFFSRDLVIATATE